MINTINQFITAHPIAALAFMPSLFVAVIIIGVILTAPTDEDNENF